MHAYLDIDIDDNRASFKRACEFVEANSIKYGLSSNNLHELGGREKLSVPELYANDFNWKDRGKCIVEPQCSTRLVFNLNNKESPLACENFMALCTHSKGKSKATGVELTYKGSRIHRYVPSFILQGGDINMGNGAGGVSIWDKKFKDDTGGLKLKHDARGILSMGNSGKNSNSSQFFITLAPAPQCNSKHVVFGKVTSGFQVLDLIEQDLTTQAKGDENPCVSLIITSCGEFIEGRDMEQGYWGEDDVFHSVAK